MARLPVDRSATAMEMAEAIFGDGVSVEEATYTGDSDSSGIYSNADTVSPGVAPSDSGVILSTGDARNFANRNGEYNQDTNQTTSSSGPNNVAEFNAIAGTSTYDAAYLDVTFIPTGDKMTMQFVFASEEYPEYVNSVYQDFVAVWVNDELVPMDIGNGDVDPGNVNDGENESLFIDNTGDAYNTEMDGFTITMTLTMDVDPGEENTIRIAIADVADASYDSNLLIAADSVQTAVIAETDTVNMGINATKTVNVMANDSNTGSTLTITHINGATFVVGVPIPLPNGQSVTVNGDGTLTFTSDGDTETSNITYTIENDAGVTDVGYVTINAAPCFVKGTLIRTPYGDVPVEDLEAGDMVETFDNGAQPIRWIGNRTVPALENLAPIRIEAGALGDHLALLVSPQHRILVRDSLAELLFDDTEVLIAAKDLVNDRTITRQVGGTVQYFHMLFDRHQIVFSQGLETESFLPGPQIDNIFEAETLDEITTIFPELDTQTGEGYSPAARRMLKAYEADVLLSRTRAA
ncbi:Hint domain-containing protein [Shimia thalassica]|uniref:Hint domain-containing protein n=1 Tax=Shimia thalassica TaxID=1715693 RepID=UPI0026E3621C|nr:Hint domain-containing protein [Shimia thalassica]MDO6479748.1 Hint domain-containing protein [Shimia thalassica]